MDDLLYAALSSYYNALSKKGYMAHHHALKLLVLIFYREFVYHDYEGRISEQDYRLIGRALNCLYGSTCLIPYPDYLKMGKLHLGKITEMANRLKVLENTDVVKVIHDLSSVSDQPESDVLLKLEED